jgi:fatty acid desaturase
LRALSKPTPIRSVGWIALEWVLVVVAVAACERFWSWPAYLLIVMWIGGRQHALLVLMHDAVHYRMLRSRRAADILADLFCAWPLLVSTDGFRRVHFQHHRHSATALDPDWRAQLEEHEYRLPKRWFQFLLLFLRDMSGLGVFRLVRTVIHVSGQQMTAPDDRSRSALRFPQLAFYGGFAVVTTWLGGWTIVLCYWVVPLLTWLKWTLYLRSIAEHHGLPGGGELFASTRTMLPSLLGRWLIAPQNIHYHIEHHLYPSVPSFRLPQLHRELMTDLQYRARARVVPGYLAVLRECIAYRPDEAPAPA